MNAINSTAEGRMPDAPWGPLTTVNPKDSKTWTLADDRLPGGYRVLTSFSIRQFAPAWNMPGTPHHFETIVIHTGCDFGNAEHTYASEADAREGHAVVLGRLRTSVERGAA